tara:strand:- start:266 stop:1447 length:1182 start_codon:yes stop_codon:yes gene_type:complete
MLEQAIADASALREQAIKNAEQSVLDKYSKQIKEAVDQMLEMEEPSALDRANETINEAEEELMQEEEAPMAAPAGEAAFVEAPDSYDSRPEANDLYVKLSAMLGDLDTDADGMINLDLGDFSAAEDELAAADGDLGGDLDPLGGLDGDLGGGDDELDLGGDLGASDEGDDLDLQLQEVLNMLGEGSEEESEEESEKEKLEEVMEIDFNEDLNGYFSSGKDPNQTYQREKGEVKRALEDPEEDSEESEDETTAEAAQVELYETLEFLTSQNNQMENVLSKMETYLEETLLSNAKLLYQNRTLNDASLNERQKSKIVEAISNAESPKEAKRLHETLKATVGSTPNSTRGPQSLSESVNRRSNLSAMLNSRQNIKETKQSANPFMEKMQKLAGIKK